MIEPETRPPEQRQEPEASMPRLEAIANLSDDDNDSAIDSNSLLTSTTASLSESILDYRRLHGRTYQNTRTAEYWAPNDEQQNDGLNLIHNGLLVMLDGQLYLAPLETKSMRVLDVGTGTGIWAVDFADQFPNAEVIGTDLSPIQPSWVPPNVQFVIDDCQLEWTWPENHFDFIHMRALYGSITDWGTLYKKAFHHLKLDGWFQNLEMGVNFQSDHVSFPKDHVFYQMADLVYQAGDKIGQSFRLSTVIK